MSHQLKKNWIWATFLSPSDRCRKEHSTASTATTNGSSQTSDTTWRQAGRNSSSDELPPDSHKFLLFQTGWERGGGWRISLKIWLPTGYPSSFSRWSGALWAEFCRGLFRTVRTSNLSRWARHRDLDRIPWYRTCVYVMYGKGRYALW